MDSKFPLLLICASATAFAGTWMFTQSKPQKLHAQEFVAQDKHGKPVVIENCAQAEAMGLAPLYAGRPGYRHELDPDDTGIACVPH